jgi:two-component system response regulator PilR (NtrC family)/two-component system response regulator HydG
VNLDEIVARRLKIEELELQYIRSVLASVKGNKREAANILGIDRKTLQRRLGQDPQVSSLPTELHAKH